MKYLLLINVANGTWADMASWSPEDLTASVAYMDELAKDLTESGELVGGQGLGGPARMKTVQARPDAELLVTDGPMIEAKELLAGYMEIDVPNMERAIEIAERWSACPAKDGAPNCAQIEIHQVMGASVDMADLLSPYK